MKINTNTLITYLTATDIHLSDECLEHILVYFNTTLNRDDLTKESLDMYDNISFDKLLQTIHFMCSVGKPTTKYKVVTLEKYGRQLVNDGYHKDDDTSIVFDYAKSLNKNLQSVTETILYNDNLIYKYPIELICLCDYNNINIIMLENLGFSGDEISDIILNTVALDVPVDTIIGQYLEFVFTHIKNLTSILNIYEINHRLGE